MPDSTLAPHTTLRLGGPAERLIVVADTNQLPELSRDQPDGPVLLLAGGSNVVIADDGVPGTVALLRTTGAKVAIDGDEVVVRVAAGEEWDGLVARAVAEGWAGIECMSGVPGSVGATPIQNVGAYGQEVAETITRVTAFDRDRSEFRDFTAAECGFSYRHSVFKHRDRFLVTEVTFRLRRQTESGPLRYADLAAALGRTPGDPAPLADVRSAVLRLRAGKGMLLDPADPDTRSVGSFFTNVVLDAAAHERFAARVAQLGVGAPTTWPQVGGWKVSAAWLIEKAGFDKGYGRDGVGISTKHTLALTNRGTGSTAALLDLAREVRAGVAGRFGVTLEPEPILVNCAL